MGGKPAEGVSNGGAPAEGVPLADKHGGGSLFPAGEAWQRPGAEKRKNPAAPCGTAGFLFLCKVLGDEGAYFRGAYAQGVSSGG